MQLCESVPLVSVPLSAHGRAATPSKWIPKWKCASTRESEFPDPPAAAGSSRRARFAVERRRTLRRAGARRTAPRRRVRARVFHGRAAKARPHRPSCGAARGRVGSRHRRARRHRRSRRTRRALIVRRQAPTDLAGRWRSTSFAATQRARGGLPAAPQEPRVPREWAARMDAAGVGARGGWGSRLRLRPMYGWPPHAVEYLISPQ